MLLSIFQWLIVISIILLPISRKWLAGMWKGIFRLVGKLFQFCFSILRRIAELAWGIFRKILELIWMLFIKIIKGLFWLVPRIVYWVGWFLVESLQFLFNALRALFEILKP